MNVSAATKSLARIMSANGSAVTVTRGASSFSTLGYARGSAPQQINGGVAQVERSIVIPAAGASFVPGAGDRVSMGGKTYAIVAADPIQIAGSVIRYNLSIKG